MRLSEDKQWVTIHWEEYEQLLKTAEKLRVVEEDLGIDLDKFLIDHNGVV